MSGGDGGTAGKGGGDDRPFTRGIAPLHVEGSRVVDPSGNTVILRGVSIADPVDVDNRDTGPTAIEVVDRLSDASQGFYARVIRIPVYPPIWFADPTGYFTDHLKPLVDHAAERGLYVIVDFHEISDVVPANDEVKAFWTLVAPEFASYTNVLYEVFNEPINQADMSWSSYKRYAQGWVDLVRSHAPHNIVLVGGPFYDQQIAGAARSPIRGTNIGYVGHVYPISASSLLYEGSAFTVVAATAPVFITEWGYRLAWGDVGAGTQTSFGNPLKAFVEAHGLSWTAWCADSVWEPVMFSADWTLFRSEGDMGGFTQDWLAEKKDADQAPLPLPVP